MKGSGSKDSQHQGSKNFFSNFFGIGHKDGKDGKNGKYHVVFENLNVLLGNDGSFFDNLTGSMTVNTNKEVEVNVSLPKNVPSNPNLKKPTNPQQKSPTQPSPTIQPPKYIQPAQEQTPVDYGQNNFEVRIIFSKRFILTLFSNTF